MRVALYARVSTVDQNCTQQLTALRDYVTTRGWTQTTEYIDHGQSGTKQSRPAFNALMDAAARQQIDVIVVWKLDRWGRSLAHLVNSIQELDALGVRFIAVTQGINTESSNAAGRLLLNILSSFAEFEHELIVERTKAGLERARKAGRIGGRPLLTIDRQLVRAAKTNMSYREAARHFGISVASVQRICA